MSKNVNKKYDVTDNIKRHIFNCAGETTDENCIKLYEQNTNFYFYDTPQDGNCLYNALSLYYTYIKNKPITHIELRTQIIRYMDNHFNYKEVGATKEEVTELYDVGVWDNNAGDLSVNVAQEALNVYINQYNIENNNVLQITTQFYPELYKRTDNTKDIISILRIHRGHFGLLVPKEIHIPENVIYIKNGIRTFIGNPPRIKPDISDIQLYEELDNDMIQCLICDNNPIKETGWKAHTKTKAHVTSYITNAPPISFTHKYLICISKIK